MCVYIYIYIERERCRRVGVRLDASPRSMIFPSFWRKPCTICSPSSWSSVSSALTNDNGDSNNNININYNRIARLSITLTVVIIIIIVNRIIFVMMIIVLVRISETQCFPGVRGLCREQPVRFRRGFQRKTLGSDLALEKPIYIYIYRERERDR